MDLKVQEQKQNLMKAFAASLRPGIVYLRCGCAAAAEGYTQIKQPVPRDRRQREGARLRVSQLTGGWDA